MEAGRSLQGILAAGERQALDGLIDTKTPMSLESSLVTHFGDVFRARGFAGGGRRWRRQMGDVTAIIEIDSPPKSRSVAMDIGVWAPAFGGREPGGVTHCPILMHMETLPPLKDVSDPILLARALHTASDMPEQERLLVITSKARALCDYLAELSSLEALQQAYRRGDLDAAAIKAETRAIIGQRSRRVPDGPDAADQE